VLLIFLYPHENVLVEDAHRQRPIVSYEGQDYKDLTPIGKVGVSRSRFTQSSTVISMLRCVSPGATAFRSGFRPGRQPPQVQPLLRATEQGVRDLIPLVFAAMPIYVFLQSLVLTGQPGGPRAALASFACICPNKSAPMVKQQDTPIKPYEYEIKCKNSLSPLAEKWRKA
jgi:hypothetical protein